MFGVASNGTVGQWDGHRTPTGILLRWFLRPDLAYPDPALAQPGVGFPDFGFDVYRATVPDIPPLPFNDLNVPLVEGKPAWTYANQITLSASAGLHFAASSQAGWWRLIVAPGATVRVTFNDPAWLISVSADAGTSSLSVIGKVAGASVRQDNLNYPGATLTWRTRGIDELELTGDGSVSFIGYHLLNDAAAWQLIAHRCLPVIDPRYPCGLQPGRTETDEARSRLPASVAAQWAARFDQAFTNLLPSLRRLATRAQPVDIPPDPNYSPPVPGSQGVRLSADEREIISLSTLDPHGARILGLAYDDPLNGALDGGEYVYKVVGRWLGEPVTLDLTADPIDPRALQKKYDVTLDLGSARSRTREIVITFGHPVRGFSLEINPTAPIVWAAKDGIGGTDSGKIGRASQPVTLTLAQVSELRLTRLGQAPSKLLRSMSWTPFIERFGLLPGIRAVEPGPPPGSVSLTVSVVPADSPSAITTADLDWPITIGNDGAIPEGEPISYQIGHRRLETDPTAPSPTPDPAKQADLMYDGWQIFVAAARALEPLGQRVLHTDRNQGAGLGPGWWGWWIRGVDLFGRVSPPSTWTLATVTDTAPPPAPVMVQAEWIQRAMPQSTVAVMGRSSEANRWLAGSTADAGLVVSWAFGPDQAELRKDVDGFHVLMRLPAQASGAYPDPWPDPIMSFGPMAIRSDGTVRATPAADPVLAVNVTAVHTLAPAPNAKSADPQRSACVTDLELDGASCVFVGGTLNIGATGHPIVGNGDGPNLTIVVQHAPGAAPVAGAAELHALTKQLVEITTDLPALSPPGNLRARSGVLVIGAAGLRFQVLRVAGGVFLCREARATTDVVTVDDTATLYPVWSASLDDTGFGPRTSDTVPVGNAQVAVRAVRGIRSIAKTSPPSVPLTVTAVYLTKPVTPTPDVIAFDPADTCARLASRADWYGKSRFTVSWTAQADRQFTVYRALGDEINRLDRLEYAKGGRRMVNFPAAADWPPNVEADAARRERVLAQLEAITQAFVISNPDARADALDAAYDAMTIDTQMLLARQDYAWPAFVAVFGVPITANSFEDILDGRSHGHWFYRVTSRTAAGLESPPSEPSPPICCPDVVPPQAPLAHMALADNGAVKLRWLESPDADLDHYDIFAARDPAAAAELETMTPVPVNNPVLPLGGRKIEQSVPRSPGDWCFWIVAVDKSGNRSAPSAMLRGRPLLPPPEPPIWVSASREPVAAPDHVALSWRHDTDQRLACLVERRPLDGGYWASVSGWLPRAVYQFNDDTLPDLNSGWEYRLRVRDHLDQVALVLPAIRLEAL